MKKLTQKQFLQFLKQSPNENIRTITAVEAFLRKQRKYVSRMPRPGTDVIHLVSGGIDSITTWAMLMDIYKLKVHPVCINTGQKRHNPEYESVAYFSNLFRKRYGKLFVKPFHISFPTSTPEISKAIHQDLHKNVHPDVLRKQFDPTTNLVNLNRQYLFPAYFPYPGALAALFFQFQRNLTIRTVFCSILPTDGYTNASQTLTALRAATFSLCAYTNDYTWQVVSLPFEKEFGSFLRKSDLIRWSHTHGIPIHRTYTCLRGAAYHCGSCLTCEFRKQSFSEADVPDTTQYRTPQTKKENTIFSEINSTFNVTGSVYKLIHHCNPRLAAQIFKKRVAITHTY